MDRFQIYIGAEWCDSAAGGVWIDTNAEFPNPFAMR